MNIIGGLLLSLLILVPLRVFSEEPAGKDRTFEVVKQRMKQRFIDFHIHSQEKERRKSLRLSEADEYARVREQQELSYEKSREEYVKNRKPKKEQDYLAMEELYEKSKEQQSRADNLVRERFIRERDKLRVATEGVEKIPEMIEVGLEE